MSTREGSASPHLRREGWDHARSAMIRLAHGFAGLSPTERAGPWAAFRAFILDLTTQGWKRGDIYHLLVDVENDETTELSQDSLDALYDYDTGLVGNVSHDCIVRLPGEPEDPQEFLRYVHGEAWMHAPSPTR